MSLLSITFHCPADQITKWEKYMEETFFLMVENLMEVEKYVISEVYSEMITEGKNYNLLLFFESNLKRTQFLENEFKNIEERIELAFGHEVMIFQTLLDPRKSRP